MIKNIAVIAALAASGAAQAAFVGGVFRLNESATTDARGTDAGEVTVFDLIIGFDEADDVLINMGNGDVSTGGVNLFQTGLGGNSSSAINPAFFPVAPEVEFDSYVAIGPALGSDSTTSADPDFAFLADGFVGGWFAQPVGNPPQFPGDAPDTANPDTGLFEVFAGRFTVEGDFLGTRGDGGGDIVEGIIFSEIFSGDIDVNWADEAGAMLTPEFDVFVGVPAPGAAALLGLGGLAAVRRRR